SIVIMLFSFLLVGLILKKVILLYFVAYIIAGILLGPYSIKVFTDSDTIAVIGELGLLIQMFFIGTKMDTQTLAENIKKPVAGVAAQLILSFIFILLLGLYQQWNWKE